MRQRIAFMLGENAGHYGQFGHGLRHQCDAVSATFWCVFELLQRAQHTAADPGIQRTQTRGYGAPEQFLA